VRPFRRKANAIPPTWQFAKEGLPTLRGLGLLHPKSAGQRAGMSRLGGTRSVGSGLGVVADHLNLLGCSASQAGFGEPAGHPLCPSLFGRYISLECGWELTERITGRPTVPWHGLRLLRPPPHSIGLDVTGHQSASGRACVGRSSMSVRCGSHSRRERGRRAACSSRQPEDSLCSAPYRNEVICRALQATGQPTRAPRSAARQRRPRWAARFR
jgi:hypothetical protein